MRNMKQLTEPSLGTNISRVSNQPVSNKQILGYCSSVEGGRIDGDINSSYRLMNVRNARFNFGKINNDYGDFTGSDLTNAEFIGSGRFGCPNLTGAILTGTNFLGDFNYFCNVSTPVKSYITFTKDRTETCITPLGQNESILINNMLRTKVTSFAIYKFLPLDISKVLELDATGFGLQGSNNDRVSRFIFTNSLGKITITGSELISSPTGITSSDIYLNSNNELIITPSENIFKLQKQSGFKIRIDIKQEERPDFREGTASVILEYNPFGPRILMESGEPGLP